MEFEDILYEKKEHTARIIINRPEVMNAVRAKTASEILHAFEDAESDRRIGVVVLTGAGNKAFCSGGDVGMMSETDPYFAGLELVPLSLKLAMTMRNMGKPIIAAINGFCLGFGNELLVFCDLAIASEKSKIGQPEVRVGSSPMFGATEFLPQIVGEKKARELIFLAKPFDAREAERIGLINKVVPEDKLEDEVENWCRIILEMSPQALRFAKTSLNSQSDILFPALAMGLRLWGTLHGTEEWKEGMKAFLEKRKPDFKKFRNP